MGNKGKNCPQNKTQVKFFVLGWAFLGGREQCYWDCILLEWTNPDHRIESSSQRDWQSANKSRRGWHLISSLFLKSSLGWGEFSCCPTVMFLGCRARRCGASWWKGSLIPTNTWFWSSKPPMSLPAGKRGLGISSSQGRQIIAPTHGWIKLGCFSWLESSRQLHTRSLVSVEFL